MVIKNLLRGFTLIELLVVLAIIASLLTITLPRYFHSVEKSNEQVLITNLNTLRDAIDKYYADKGQYPKDLSTLVNEEYLKEIPLDPITDSRNTWMVEPSRNANEAGVAGVRSGASGTGMNGTPFANW